MKQSVARLGNKLYTCAPGIYMPMYSIYKAISDRAERQLIARHLAPGMTVIDVGANVGVYTRFFLAQVGPSGKVIALEPDAENHRRLTIALKGKTGVSAMHAAASDVTGTCTLYLSDDLNVDHQTYDSGESRHAVTVPAYRIDDLVPAGTRVDFIKMDIQGAEPIAMSGAERVLAENQAIMLLFEYWPYGIRRSGRDPEQFLTRLREHGFSLRTVDGSEASGFGSGKDDYYNIIARR